MITDNCYSAIWFKVNRLLQTKENVINALLMLYNLKEHEEDKTLNTWLKDAGEREKEKWGKLSILQSMCLKMKPWMSVKLKKNFFAFSSCLVMFLCICFIIILVSSPTFEREKKKIIWILGTQRRMSKTQR